MQKGKTIGVILYRWEGVSPRYLLLHKQGEYWSFAKGRPEKGEEELETALREVEEETGITKDKITLIPDFRDTFRYDFDSEIQDGVREKIYREAIFFLGEVAEGVDVNVSDEHLDSGWFDIATAKERAFYQGGRDQLDRANTFLLKHKSMLL